MGSGGGKKELGHGEDSSASIPLKTVVRDFLAAKEKHLRHPECFSFLSMDEGLSIEIGDNWKSLKRKAEKELENNYNPQRELKARRV